MGFCGLAAGSGVVERNGFGRGWLKVEDRRVITTKTELLKIIKKECTSLDYPERRNFVDKGSRLPGAQARVHHVRYSATSGMNRGE